MHSLSNIHVRPPPPRPTGKRSGLQWWLAIGLAVLGGAVGFLAAKYGVQLSLPVSSKLLKVVVVLSLPVIWMLVVGVHELGHLVGGWAGGGRFLLWVVGPLIVQRTPRGVRPGLNRSFNLAGGMAACVPLEPEKMTPRRMAVMIIAGPLFSAALAVALLWTAAALGATDGAVSDLRAILQHSALMGAALSALVMALTLFPTAVSGFKSDGKRAFELLRGGPASDQEAAFMLLTTLGLAGVRPADYPADLVARTLALRDGSLFDRYAHVSAYAYAADRGDWAAAQSHLDYALAGEAELMPHLRDVIRCEYAFLLAREPKAAPVARAWLDSAGRLVFDPATRARAEAAVLLAEGQFPAAAAKAREGLELLERKSLSPTVNAFARDALEEIVRRGEAAMASAAS